MILPNKIKGIIKDKKMILITEAHVSGDEVYNINDEYILKVSTNIDTLLHEKNINDYLLNKANVSKSIFFIVLDNKAYYLKTCLKGENLVNEKYLKDPYKLAKILSKAMKLFHSIDISECNYYSKESKGNIFTHGDFCLPNILIDENGMIGFIDTTHSGIGDPWIDYAWCIWSYEYNLKSKEYTHILLKELDIEFDKEKYEYYVNNI